MREKINNLPEEFKRILPEISKIASRLNFKIYLVGGVVRDLILNQEILDLDIVVEAEAIKLAQEVTNYFNLHAKKIGIKSLVKFNKHHSFGTATVIFENIKIDFATARKEVYSHPGALPKVVAASLREDLFRRDFTINAMAISLNENDYGKLIDYYNGLNDLRKGIIRILHKNSFVDDPTRIIRAIRFNQRFYFAIEKNTMLLLKEALTKGALSFVHRHRLIDELILTLKEKEPYFYIKQIDKLCGFSFLNEKIKLNNNDYKLFLNIAKAIKWYNKKFAKYRKLDIWLIYFSVFFIRLSLEEILDLFHGFCLRKGERIRILSIKDNIKAFKKLDKKLKPYDVFKIIDHLSFESIIFLYAYYYQKQIRKNIEYFLSTLVNVRLKTKGLDLQNLNIEPKGVYAKLLNRLLEIKMNKKIDTSEQELTALKGIIKSKKF